MSARLLLLALLSLPASGALAPRALPRAAAPVSASLASAAFAPAAAAPSALAAPAAAGNALDPKGALSWAPSPNLAEAEAKELRHEETYSSLQTLAAERYGWDGEAKRALDESRPLVSERAPIGLPERGRPSWLANLDFRGNTQRSIGISLGRAGLLKVKGSGADQRAWIGNGSRSWRRGPQPQRWGVGDVPIMISPNPLGAGNAYTWRALHALPLEDARIEFQSLLQAHALFTAAFGRPAPFPIPVALRRVDSAELRGETVELARLWAEPRYWPDLAGYGKHLRGVAELARALEPGLDAELARGLAPGEARRGLAEAGIEPRSESAFAELMYGARRLARKLLGRADSGAEPLAPPAMNELMYKAYRLARSLLEKDPMGQLALIERAPARNVDVPADDSRAAEFSDFRERAAAALLRSYGEKMKPGDPRGEGRNARAFARTLWKASREAGEAYGFLVGIGAKIEYSFTPKDMVGGQPTDFLDMGVPVPGTEKFNPVPARAEFWVPAIAEPQGLHELLFGDGKAAGIRARSQELFLASARRSFRRTVEQLMIQRKGSERLSPGYRRSLLAWFGRQADKRDDELLSEEERRYQRVFTPVVEELRGVHPRTAMGPPRRAAL